MTDMEKQRAFAGWPTKRETLNYFLEDLKDRLSVLEGSRSHDLLAEGFDRDFFSNARYRYYEVLHAARVTAQDILYAISEVEEKLWRLDEEEGIAHFQEAEEQLDGQVVLFGFLNPAAMPDMAYAS